MSRSAADYSIPGKFVVIIQPHNAPRQPPPPHIGHCLLCLRRLCASTGTQNLRIGETLDDLTIVPKAVLPEDELLPTFNKLLPFIHKKWKSSKKGNQDPPDLLNKNMPEYQQQAPDSGSSIIPKNFPHLPAMCTLCGEQLQRFDGLIRQLSGKIEEIKGIIKMSKMPAGKFGWRQLQFEDDLRNNEDLTEMSRRKTMDFLEGFAEVEEEEEAVNEEEEEAVVVEEATGERGEDEEDPLAFNEQEDEEDDFVVQIETEEVNLQNEEEDEDDGRRNEEGAWSSDVKMEPPDSGPSYQSSKRARRIEPKPGPASKTGRKKIPSEIISGPFEERRVVEKGPRRSSRITIDNSRTLGLSSLSSSLSAVVNKDPDKLSYK